MGTTAGSLELRFRLYLFFLMLWPNPCFYYAPTDMFTHNCVLNGLGYGIDHSHIVLIIGNLNRLDHLPEFADQISEMDWVYGMAHLFDSFVMRWWDDPRVVRIYYPLQVFITDWFLMFVNQTQVRVNLIAHNWQKWKVYSLHVPCHKIYTVKAVGLKSSNYTLKITIFVNMWNLGQFCEKLIFCQ